MESISPVNENVASPDPRRVDEVIALQDKLGQVLLGRISRLDNQILFVLNGKGRRI
jgi:hypothetical protein